MKDFALSMPDCKYILHFTWRYTVRLTHIGTYQRLYHVDSVASHLVDAAEDVYLSLGRRLLQQIVQGDEGPCPPNTRAIMYHRNFIIRVMRSV